MLPLFKNNEVKVHVVLKLRWQMTSISVAKRSSCKVTYYMTALFSDDNSSSPGCRHNLRTEQVIKQRSHTTMT